MLFVLVRLCFGFGRSKHRRLLESLFFYVLFLFDIHLLEMRHRGRPTAENVPFQGLKDKLMRFRVTELKALLRFAGQREKGTKSALRARALELIRIRNIPIERKIEELHEKLLQESGEQPTAPMPCVHHANLQIHLNRHGRSVMQAASSYRGNRALLPTLDTGMCLPRSLPTPVTGMYPTNTYHIPLSNLPTHPDVRLKRLPFFDFLKELLKPSTLIPQYTKILQERSFGFHLTPQQANDVSSSRSGSKMEHDIQVQIRFCMMETSCEQEDCYPLGLTVSVNCKPCPLPTNRLSYLPKLPLPPLNITDLMHLSPTEANHVTVKWHTEDGKNYCISIGLVRKVSSSELLQRLKQKGYRHPDITKGLIKQKLQEDDEREISSTSLHVPLLCPLGKMRMTTPCRSNTCSHLQCFDAFSYLQMNEKKPTWMCPVCDKPATFDNLLIDGYFTQVLASVNLGESNEIHLHQDGSWTTFTAMRKPEDLLEPSVSGDVVILSQHVKKPPLKKPNLPKKDTVLIDLTLSDSDAEPDSVQEVSD